MDLVELKKVYKQRIDEIEDKFFHLLVDSGADLDAVNADGDNALMISINSVCVTRFFLVYSKPDSKPACLFNSHLIMVYYT